MIPGIRTYVLNATKNKEYGQYFNRLAKIHSQNFSWDDQKQAVILKSDALISNDAIEKDIIFWGLENVTSDLATDHDNQTITTANTNIDNMISSVKTFTTGHTSKKQTGQFDDASTIASVNSTDTDASDSQETMVPSSVTIRRELVKLTNSITLLKVNDKTRSDESKTILGKLENLEKVILTTQSQPPSTTGTQHTPGGQEP